MNLNHKLSIGALAFILAGCSSSDNAQILNDNSDQSPKTSITGVAIDGYLAHAKVCIDLNLNTLCDKDEPSATTNTDGRFALEATEYQRDNFPLLVVATEATIDSDNPGTSVGQGFTFIAPPGSGVISPFSTLIHQEQQSSRLSSSDAEEVIKKKLGLQVSLSIDYVAKKKGNTAYNDVHLYAQALTNIIAEGSAEAKKQTSASPYQQFSGTIQSINNWLSDESASAVLITGKQAALPEGVKNTLEEAIKNQPRGLERTSLSELGTDAFIVLIEADMSSNESGKTVSSVDFSAIPVNTTKENEKSGEWYWVDADKKWWTELEAYRADGEEEKYLQHLENNPLGYDTGWYLINGEWVENPFESADCVITETIQATNVLRNYCDFAITEISVTKVNYDNKSIATILSNISMANDDPLPEEDRPAVLEYLKKATPGEFTSGDFYEITFREKKELIIIHKGINEDGNEYGQTPLANTIDMKNPENFEFYGYKLLENGNINLNSELAAGMSWKKTTRIGMDMIEIIDPSLRNHAVRLLVNKDSQTFDITFLDETKIPYKEIGITNSQFNELTESLKKGTQ